MDTGPPVAGTVASSPPRGTNRMTPVELQVAPLRAATSASVRTCPPPASTRFNFPAATNPMADPSGAQNGCAASSVPASAWGASASRSRTQSLDPPDASVDTYASRRPSGETATDICGVTCPGAAIDRRVGVGVGAGSPPRMRRSASAPSKEDDDGGRGRCQA